MRPTQYHIVILDCDTPVPNVYAERGLYSDIFATILRKAALNTQISPELNLQFSKYDCVLGHLPSEEDLLQVDAMILTGSAASAYDPAPWIISLTSYIKGNPPLSFLLIPQLTQAPDLYMSHPRIKLFGSCFGHQIISHALFSTPTQPVVTRDPAGWELGVHAIHLSVPFLTHFGPVTSNLSSPSSLRLQFVHADHVVLPPSLLAKDGFDSIGRSAHCALQGIWKRGRVLTYQGHAEFDCFVNEETVRTFGKAWEESVLEASLQSIKGDDDRDWAVEAMLKFFLDSVVEKEDAIDGEVGDVVREEEVMAML